MLIQIYAFSPETLKQGDILYSIKNDEFISFEKLIRQTLPMPSYRGVIEKPDFVYFELIVNNEVYDTLSDGVNDGKFILIRERELIIKKK